MKKLSLIFAIVDMGQADKVFKYARKYGVHGGTVSIGRGTVSNKMLEFLGIDETERELVKMVAESEVASEAMKGMSKDMSLEKPNNGIIFSHTVDEFISNKYKDFSGELNNDKEDSMYKAIYVVVDRGEAESVVEAAKTAGARGATIMNAREVGENEAHKVFSIEIEPEKERVLIVTKTEGKDAIISAVREYLNIDEGGNGFIFVLDISEAYGLR